MWSVERRQCARDRYSDWTTDGTRLPPIQSTKTARGLPWDAKGRSAAWNTSEGASCRTDDDGRGARDTPRWRTLLVWHCSDGKNHQRKAQNEKHPTMPMALMSGPRWRCDAGSAGRETDDVCVGNRHLWTWPWTCPRLRRRLSGSV